jgi:hypothetical protein
MSVVDPSQVLMALTSDIRPQKRQNLEIIHQVCGELHRLGSRDFSIATVGRMSEERGGMSRRALYNSTSRDFKTLIQAWAAWATGSGKNAAAAKSRDTEAATDDNHLLRRLDDPALRTLFGFVIAERDRLRGEVKLLRQQANVVVDRRVLPGYVNVTPQGQVVQVMSSVGLSETEKQALSQAISESFLGQEGWSEGPDGEIWNARGRKLFDIGFANAIRKVLKS